MPLVLLAAFAASLITHATALFLPDGDWLPASHEESPITLQAELQIPPAVPAKVTEKLGQAVKPPKAHKPKPAQPTTEAIRPSDPVTMVENQTTATQEVQPLPPQPPPGNSANGSLSYRVYKGSNGFEVGRSIHRWEITDQQYKLVSITETSGLAGLFYPLRIEMQSTGRFGAEGFIPEHFRTLKQGAETNENADFNWENHTVLLSRDGKTRALAANSQDLLSFHFQLAYRARQLGIAETAFPMHVASGKRYDPFNFTVQGEEVLETKAGTFRTLHLKATAPNNSADTTDVWLAIDRYWLAVKIQFTDRNGDSFEQVIDALQTSLQTQPAQDKP